MLTPDQAKKINAKIIEIKEILSKEYFTVSFNNVSITISLMGNIKEVVNPLNKSLEEIIPVINEATAKARQDYEIKQAQLLQKEMMNLM